MSNILVVAEHHGGKLRKVTLPVIGFAQQAKAQTGGQIIALVLGSGVDGVAAEVAKYGVDKVVVHDNAAFANYLAETYAPSVANAAKALGASIVAAPASTRGRDFIPRAAAILDAPQVSDAIEVGAGLTYKRPIWAGNLIETVKSTGAITTVTVRTTGFDAPAAGASAPVEAIDTGISINENQSFVSFEEVKSERPALTDADVIISGGRGLKARENFGMLEELADLLKGAVGASRAAVDSGMAPNDWQIGQTGKIVAPNLYVAVAISGAIQHLAGMKGSKTIVAINKDPEAPIFQVADFGLVADAFQAVPELTSALKSR